MADQQYRAGVAERCNREGKDESWSRTAAVTETLPIKKRPPRARAEDKYVSPAGPIPFCSGSGSFARALGSFLAFQGSSLAPVDGGSSDAVLGPPWMHEMWGGSGRTLRAEAFSSPGSLNTSSGPPMWAQPAPTGADLTGPGAVFAGAETDLAGAGARAGFAGVGAVLAGAGTGADLAGTGASTGLAGTGSGTDLVGADTAKRTLGEPARLEQA